MIPGLDVDPDAVAVRKFVRRVILRPKSPCARDPDPKSQVPPAKPEA